MARWLVIYYNGNETKAAVIDDVESDGTVSMPYGITPAQVADDCEDITAIILCADPPNVPFVVIDDCEFPLGQPNEDIPESGD